MSQAVPRTLGNIFFLHIPKRVEDTIWIGGRELYFDGSYAEHFNKKLGGVMVVEPGVLGDQYLLSRRGSASGNVPCSDIQDEVKVGDILYVDWSVSEPHNEVNRNNVPDLDLPGIGGVYKASANQVVARVREGELIPYGSYVLCKEVFPDGVQDVRVGEHTLKLRLSKSGLALGSESIPPVPFQGEVVHVGLPLRGQPQRVRPGDRVVFDKRMCGKADGLPLKMKIEGVEYLCIRQDYIEAVLETVPQGIVPTYLTQLYTVAEHGFGDCWRTAIACLMGLSNPTEVPIFIRNEDGTDNDDWWVDTWNWLYEKGFEIDHYYLDEDNPAPAYPHMVSGLSPRKYPDGSDMYHSVIAEGERIIHDPHPSREGVLTRKTVFTVRQISAL